jgi:putative copper export protein
LVYKDFGSLAFFRLTVVWRRSAAQALYDMGHFAYVILIVVIMALFCGVVMNKMWAAITDTVFF